MEQLTTLHRSKLVSVRSRRAIAVLLAIVVTALVAQWPTTTRYGIDYQVFSKQIPLYEKAINFLSRDLQARRLAAEVTAGASDDRARLEKIFRWVGRNVRPVPNGFPTVDDHVWNIIVRGYGADDQITEVFTLLASYSCCSATLAELRAAPTKAILVAVVDLEGMPRVFDVAHQLIFRNDAGDFASIDDLARNPRIIAAVGGGLTFQGEPYMGYFADIGQLRPKFGRMELQKPWQRLKGEARRLFPGT